jgi:1-acyl-sn-glycerol-3-phosphate acyltransferase
VSLARFLNRPGVRGRLWRGAYESGYTLLRTMVLIALRPLFGVRRLGPEPRWPRGGFIVCANHTSYLDPAFLQLLVRRRVTFLMTNDFYSRPAARWFFALVGALPMRAGRMGHASLRRAAAMLRRGYVVGLFPEGRLSTDGRPNPAHRGVGVLARRGRVPVVPAGIRGAFRAWPRGARWFRPATVRVLFGVPLRHAGAAGAAEKAEDREFARELMVRISALAGQPAPGAGH